MSDRLNRLKNYLARIAPGGDPANLESVRTLRANAGLESGFEGMGDPESRKLAAVAEALVSNHEAMFDPMDMANFEAIILPKERPVVLIRNGTFSAPDWEGGVLARPEVATRLNRAIGAVGRVEVGPAFGIPYAGTAFFVGPGLMMTNRHVAQIFARGLGRMIRYRSGSATLDLLREADNTQERTLEIDAVRMIHPYWDMALLEVSGDLTGIELLTLSDVAPEDAVGRYIAAIGYPAMDPRSDIDVQRAVFGDTFQVKRLMPGKVLAPRPVASFEQVVSALCHEASTLGGASGSAVVDLTTGDVVALHFGGIYLDANFGVPAWALAADPRVRDAGVNVKAVSATGPWGPRWDELTDEAPTSGRVASLRAPDSPPPKPPAPTVAAPGEPPKGGTTRVTREISVQIPITVTVDVGTITAGSAEVSTTLAAEPSSPESTVPEPIDDAGARARFAETTSGDEVVTEAPLLGRQNIKLIADDLSPSLRHVGQPLSATPFTLTAAVLERLVAANHFGAGLAAWGGDLVLFGLRGCRLATDPDSFPPERDLQPRLGFPADKDRQPDRLPLWNSTNGFVTSASLVEDTVTHVLPRCLLGVWNRKTGQFALVRGTTAPNWDYSAQAIETRRGHDDRQGDANMLLPGLYRYTVGHHKGIPDALRLTSEDHGAVRPSATNKAEISYTVRDRFWWDTPSQDNLHPSYAGGGSATNYVFHYSAGCQTIQGSFDDKNQRHSGAWSVFRRWAGLAANTVDTAAIGTRRFSYILLTGREARLAATGATDAAIARLRYGSRGPAVSTLQSALATTLKKPAHATGVFDGETQKRLVIWQWTRGAHKDSADGVLAPTEATTLGVPLVPTAPNESVGAFTEALFPTAAPPALCLPQDDPNQAARAVRIEFARNTWRLGLWSYGDGQDTVKVTASPIPKQEIPSVAWATKAVPGLATIASNTVRNRAAWTFRDPLEGAAPTHDPVSDTWEALAERAEQAADRLATGGTLESAAMAAGGDLVAEATAGLGAVLGLGDIASSSNEATFSLAGPRGRPKDLSDYASLFRALPQTASMAAFMAATPGGGLAGLTDDAFVRARLVGSNPEMLDGVDGVPDGFPAALKLPDGEKASAAAKAGRLFLADWSAVATLVPGTTNGVQKYISTPRALFAVSKATNQVVPVAIQCDPGGPIVVPADVGWTRAKHVVAVADGNHHELVSHLARTHLLVEPFVLATHRCLSDAHPLFRLLLPHFEGTIFINDQARGEPSGFGLIRKGGVIDRTFAGTIESSQTLAVQGVADLDFASWMLPSRVAARQLDAISDYPWRDDALRVYGAIEAFVRKYVRRFYPNASVFAGDNELRAWGAVLTTILPKFKPPTTVDGLVDTLTLVIYSASAQHAAVNFTQYPEMSFPPVFSGAGWSDATPTAAGEAAMLDFFPPLDLAESLAETLFLLSSVHHTVLGGYAPGWFGITAIDEGLVREFQAALVGIEAQITLANQTRRWAYSHLRPSLIPQSINI